MELLYQSEEQDLVVEAIELNEVQEYCDVYTPNKYGQLFRERLFIQEQGQNSTGTQVTLQLVLKMKDQVQHMESTQQKGKKMVEQEEAVEERELGEHRSIYLQLLERQAGEQSSTTWDVTLHSIFKVTGNNQVLMTNLQLFPQRNYYLVAGFNLQEDPHFQQQSTNTHPDQQDQEEQSNIWWNLQVYTGVDGNVALVKDNSKESFENDIRKAWETNQTGRAEKAVRERKKFHLKKKQNNQEQLTEEELALLSEQRNHRSKQAEEQVDQNKKGNTKQVVKKEVGKKEVAKQQGQQVEEKQEKIKRPVPSSHQHQMQEITVFLEKMEEQRVIQERPQHPGLIGLRSEEQMGQLKESIQLEQEHLLALTHALQANREQGSSQEQVDTNQNNNIDYTCLGSLLEQREAFRKEYVVRREHENRLLELCGQTSPTQSDLEKALEQVMGLKNYDRQLVSIAQKQSVNLKILQAVEDLNEAANNYDVDKITALLEMINDKGIQVDQPLLERARDIQEEANDNPNFIAEKQLEAKKSGKKGKK